MGAYGDMLSFNTTTLQTQIGVLTEVRDTIQNLKTKYVDYVNNQLRPAWKLDGGDITANQLINFAEIDIEAFITYLTERISDLEAAKVKTIQIDQA